LTLDDEVKRRQLEEWDLKPHEDPEDLSANLDGYANAENDRLQYEEDYGDHFGFVFVVILSRLRPEYCDRQEYPPQSRLILLAQNPLFRFAGF